jgi:hypothetical protein
VSAGKYLDKVDWKQGFQLGPILFGHLGMQNDKGGQNRVALSDLLGETKEALWGAADDDVIAQPRALHKTISVLNPRRRGDVKVEGIPGH